MSKSSERFDVTVCRGTSKAASELVLLFEQIASEEGWTPGNALRAYTAQSEYVGLFTRDEPIGGIQIVLPTADASWWPSRAVWPEREPYGRADIGHILIMAVRQDYRGRKELFWRMCAHVWGICIARSLEEVWLEVTPATLRVYQRIGFPLEIIGPCRLHWGEGCVLTRMTLTGVTDAVRVRAESSGFYRKLFEYASNLAADPYR